MSFIPIRRECIPSWLIILSARAGIGKWTPTSVAPSSCMMKVRSVFRGHDIERGSTHVVVLLLHIQFLSRFGIYLGQILSPHAAKSLGQYFVEECRQYLTEIKFQIEAQIGYAINSSYIKMI